MKEEYKHPDLKHLSGRLMELDIYIESLKLAFEYQGEQHYKPIAHHTKDFEQQQTRDLEKKRACKQVNDSSHQILTARKHDITLIEVPHRWDKKTESLSATIHKARSDPIPDPPVGVDPIPTSNPNNTQPLLVPLSHGYNWDSNQDLTGW